jgi:hypothetical protein
MNKKSSFVAFVSDDAACRRSGTVSELLMTSVGHSKREQSGDASFKRRKTASELMMTSARNSKREKRKLIERRGKERKHVRRSVRIRNRKTTLRNRDRRLWPV